MLPDFTFFRLKNMEAIRGKSMFHDRPNIFTFTRFEANLYTYTIITLMDNDVMDGDAPFPANRFSANIHFVPR